MPLAVPEVFIYPPVGKFPRNLPSVFEQFNDLLFGTNRDVGRYRPWERHMTAECSFNVLSLFCRSQFRECAQVEDTSYEQAMLVPSLLCRSECERHHEIWNQCVADLEKNPVDKAAFNNMMQTLANDADLLRTVPLQDEVLPRANGSFAPFRLLECDAPGGDKSMIPTENNAVGQRLFCFICSLAYLP